MPHFAIADTGAAASSLLNGLNAAANQRADLIARQQAQQAVQDHQDQQDQFRAVQDGWIPANAETPMPGGMIDRTKPSTPNQDPLRKATIGKKAYYKPTDLESGKTFVPTGPLGEALKSAGWDGKTPISSEHSHGIMQSLNEAQPKDEGWDIDATGKFLGADGKPTPVMIGKKTGTVRMLNMGGGAQPGAQPAQQGSAPGAAPGGPFADLPEGMEPDGGGSPRGAAPGGAFSFALPDKGDKPDVQQMIPGQQGPNGGALVFNKNSQTIEEVPYPKGSKPVMTAAQTEADKDRHVRQSELEDVRSARKADADQRRADAQAKVEEQFARNHEAAGTKKDAMQAMAKGYWDAKGTEPEGTYFPPRYVNGIVVPGPATRMPSKGPEYDGRLKELETTAKGFEKTAARHQAEQQRIEKQRGWGQFAPSAPAAAAPALPEETVSTSEPAKAPDAPKKKYTSAEITSWAKANGKDPADALARAKKAGLL